METHKASIKGVVHPQLSRNRDVARLQTRGVDVSTSNRGHEASQRQGDPHSWQNLSLYMHVAHRGLGNRDLDSRSAGLRCQGSCFAAMRQVLFHEAGGTDQLRGLVRLSAAYPSAQQLWQRTSTLRRHSRSCRMAAMSEALP